MARACLPVSLWRRGQLGGPVGRRVHQLDATQQRLSAEASGRQGYVDRSRHRMVSQCLQNVPNDLERQSDSGLSPGNQYGGLLIVFAVRMTAHAAVPVESARTAGVDR